MKTSDQIEWQLAKAGLHPAAKIVKDAAYKLPELRWLKGAYSTALRSHLITLGMDGFQDEANDCDDYCVAAYHLMSRANAKQHVRAAIAFGFLRYLDRRPAVGWHWINFAVVKSGVVFYEPQRQEVVTLNAKEIASCNALYV